MSKRLSSITIAFVAALTASTALAQAEEPTTCPGHVPSVSKNCTTENCVFEACWSEPQPMTGCSMLISSPAGDLPTIIGTINGAKNVCRAVAPKLPQGTYTIGIVGTNNFGAGPQGAPRVVVQTGATPVAATSIAAK